MKLCLWIWQGRGQYNHAIMVNWRSGEHRAKSCAFTTSPWNINNTFALTNVLLKKQLTGSNLDSAIKHTVGHTVMTLTIIEDLADPANHISLNANWKDLLGLPGLGLPGLHFKRDSGGSRRRAVAHIQRAVAGLGRHRFRHDLNRERGLIL